VIYLLVLGGSLKEVNLDTCVIYIRYLSFCKLR
jgi:hypothetical protein